MSSTYPETNRSLWTLAAAPAIWAAHFLLSYATAAIWCAKLGGPDASLQGVRVAIAGGSAAALAMVAVVGWRARRRWQTAAGSTLDRDLPVDREAFLARATLLLAALSAVAIAFATLAIVFVRTCR
jgi:hypothetical protein